MRPSTTGRTRFPKKIKNKNQPKHELVTQRDYYLEATDFEEQAERWLLSDIKKSLRFYLKAFEMYEMGLNAVERTIKCTYNIMYNETRILLQLYSDYLANNGYIDIIQYINLDDMPDVRQILRGLPEIISRFEYVYEQYSNESNIDTWDLQSNLLISYLTLLESNEKYSLSAEDIITLCNKYFQISSNLIIHQIEELQEWQTSIVTNDNDVDDLNRDTIDIDSSKMSSHMDGSGVITQSKPTGGNDTEYVEVSDQITSETLSDVIVNSLKFDQSLLEIIIDTQNNIDAGSLKLNDVQINYLQDVISKSILQLNDIITSNETLNLNLNEIDLVKFNIEGMKLLLDNDIAGLENYISIGNQEIEVNLIKIDVLETVISSLPDIRSNNNINNNEIDYRSYDMNWKFSSLLGKLLTETRNLLSSSRNAIIQGNDQGAKETLSSVVFQLCDITVSSSDNEMHRWELKNSLSSLQEAQDPSKVAEAQKVMAILHKNAGTLLANAMATAQRPCGMQEAVTDKLKRNYIYLEAKNRAQRLAERAQQRDGPAR